MPDNPKYLTAAEVANRLGVNSRTVRRHIMAGEFPNAFRLGGNPTAPYAIPLTDVIAYEKKLARPPSGGKAS